jgi:hypothetical protein
LKVKQKIVRLDPYEEGAVITALNDLRNKEISQEECSDFTNELILKVIGAPVKKARLKNEAR